MRYADADKYAVLWRFVRTAKSGWSIAQAAMMTKLSRSFCHTCIKVFLKKGFVVQVGQIGKTRLFKSSASAVKNPETQRRN